MAAVAISFTRAAAADQAIASAAEVAADRSSSMVVLLQCIETRRWKPPQRTTC